jgi:hypothetical protein
MLFLFGCSKKPGGPLSFYLSDQGQSGAAVQTNTAALVVTQLEMVASEAAQRSITIKLLPADASSFERLTTDNFGKPFFVVQGTNVLATPKITQPIPAQAGIMLPIGTNVDFEHTYRELLKLSRQ